MRPEDYCRQVIKLIPRLVLEEKCVNTPKEDCKTVTLPTTVKRPVVKETCRKQGKVMSWETEIAATVTLNRLLLTEREILLVFGGCDAYDMPVNSSLAVDLAKKTIYYEYIVSASSFISLMLVHIIMLVYNL